MTSLPRRSSWSGSSWYRPLNGYVSSGTVLFVAACALLVSGCRPGRAASAEQTTSKSALMDFAPPRHPGVLFWPTPTNRVDPRFVQFGKSPDCGCASTKRLGISVLLPRGYDGRRRFPVLYLLHGAGEAHDTFLTHPTPRNGELGGDIRRLARSYPAIIVMLEGSAFGWYSNWWNGGRLGAPAWESYHLDEVLPLVERRLRVRPGRRWHAIAGWSMGGMGALFYASQRPDYFGAAESLSGRISIRLHSFQRSLARDDPRRTYIWGDPLRQNFYWAGHDPTALVPNLRATRVYVRVGDGRGAGAARDSPEAQTEQGLLREARSFTAVARRAGVPATMQVVKGIHNGLNERGGLADALSRLSFGPVPPSPTTWTYRTVARRGEAWGVRFRFPRQPHRLVTIRRRAGRLLVDGSGFAELGLPGRPPVTVRLPLSEPLFEPR